MILSEIQVIQADPHAPILITNLSQIGSYSVINDYVALSVSRVSNSLDHSNPISISHHGITKGYLIFTSKRSSIDISSMTEFEFISFLTVASISDYSNSGYTFDSDFLLIKSDFIMDYIMNYQKKSILWGGFVHDLPIGAPLLRYKSLITNIEIGDELKEFDEYSFENCVRAIEQPYAFERFLKMYHLLELQFDYSVIEKIKNLTIPADSNKIGKILNEYSINELQRLTDLIENNCSDISSLEQNLTRVCPFLNIAEDMFINFGKSKNVMHLINPDKLRAVVASGSFSAANLQTLKVHSATEHDKFIFNITAYWIYKIRCSIAHNKIGEYLLSWNDENFIVDFGEPLLKEVLIQYFKK
jgi:hypothetical protein